MLDSDYDFTVVKRVHHSSPRQRFDRPHPYLHGADDLLCGVMTWSEGEMCSRQLDRCREIRSTRGKEGSTEHTEC
jgi:hypothetical protein